MNEDDLKQRKSKKAKVEKTVEAQLTEEPASKKARKKAQPKITAEAKVEKVSAKKVEPKIKKTPLKEKIENVTFIDEAVEAKSEPKPKKATAQAEKVTEQPEAKVKKPRTKKTAAVTSAEKDEAQTDALPLAAKIQTQENYDLRETSEETELSPVFKELAEPKLPALREENRAFLQMQSPTRVFFYWSLKQDSYNTLRRALGNRADDYFLAIRLINLSNNREEIHQVGNKGSWWFNQIEADAKYRAEVGFYAPSRPFVRIVFSNVLETPRLTPSANVAYQPYFAVTADQFAEVLDLAGFSQDAFEVSMAGDEPQTADEATQKAFVQLAGKAQVDFSNINISELRYVLFALASGVSLYSLRENVPANLFEFLSALTDQNPDALTEEKVILALEEFFGVSLFSEEIEEEFAAPAVFGASLINFPKQKRRKTAGRNPQPLSSFSLK